MISVLRAALAASITLAAALGAIPKAQGESLRELIPPLLTTHNLIKAAEADLQAAGERTKAAYGGWYPNLNVRSSYGYEHQNKPAGTPDTNMVPREADFTVTQLLWDFGATNATIRGTDFRREAARYNLEVNILDVLLRGTTAYLTLQRSAEVVGYALQSEDNIKRQTDIEDALVRRGAGLSTDVLNAKQQLAGAQARRVAAEGALILAKNDFRAVFQKEMADTTTMEKPVLPLDALPPDVEEAVRIALQENPILRRLAAEVRVARETSARARSEGFFPRVNAVGETKFKEDVDGTFGNQNQQLGKVEMNFPFNLGFTAINTLRASDQEALAVEKRLGEQRDIVEKDTRDAWSRLETGRARLDFLRNQSNILAEVLDLTRRERQLGTRTLNDILRAETDLINANSDAASAETDVAVAAYTVLKHMGRLNEPMITEPR